MYLYLSLVERKVAEFYHNMFKMTYFHRFLQTIEGVLDNLLLLIFLLDNTKENTSSVTYKMFCVLLRGGKRGISERQDRWWRPEGDPVYFFPDSHRPVPRHTPLPPLLNFYATFQTTKLSFNFLGHCPLPAPWWKAEKLERKVGHTFLRSRVLCLHFGKTLKQNQGWCTSRLSPSQLSTLWKIAGWSPWVEYQHCKANF